jgi:branched-subunit amino acid transport protein
MKVEIIPIIIGMGIVTYIPRWLPLFFLSRRRLPALLIDWLDFIPAAILSALVLPSIVTTGEPRHLVWVKPDLWVALPTLVFALKTKSLAGTVVIGMAFYWLAAHFH